MDNLDVNPLYKAFSTKFTSEFEIACKMSYLIAIPHSESLDGVVVDQFLVNSHILMPSRLLKKHYIPLQIGYTESIEIDGKKLIVHSDRNKPVDKVVNILAEQLGYNVKNKEFRIILIDQPLWTPSSRAISRNSLPSSFSKGRPLKPLSTHQDCTEYLNYLSQNITKNLDDDVKRLQTNYIILSDYLNDAADRIKDLADIYVVKYAKSFDNGGKILYDSVEHAIRLSVENHILHLLHDKLIDSIQNRYKKDDRLLLEKFDHIHRSGLTICQLGAQEGFADFSLNERLLHELKLLPKLQSPLALVSKLVSIVTLISESLNRSVKLRALDSEKVAICSDDLIASFVYSLSHAKVKNLYTISKYLETFGYSSNGKDQAAYYTATFQVVIHYIYTYKNEVDSSSSSKLDLEN